MTRFSRKLFESTFVPVIRFLSEAAKASRNSWLSSLAITWIKTERAAPEGLSAQGYDTVMAQSEIEWVKESGEVVENVGGREGIRTPGLLVANGAYFELRRGSTIT